MKLKFAILMALLIIAGNAYPSTIHGNVYEWYTLEPLNDVVIEVSSQPMQRVVSKDGQYDFELPPGTYKITAEYFEGRSLKYVADEKVAIKGEGNYVLDLIMFPPLEEDLNELEESILDTEEEQIDLGLEELPDNGFTSFTNSYNLWIRLIVVISILYFVFAREFVRKLISKSSTGKAKKIISAKPAAAATDEGLDKYAIEVLDLLRRSGNRLTQKEIRDKSSVGEAKVSLIISELEASGKIKKIKKGRGNIIVLKG